MAENFELATKEFISFAHQGVKGCPCRACTNGIDDNGMHYFIVCATCGNKRCPKASDHRYLCTNSNDVGQVGVVA